MIKNEETQSVGIWGRRHLKFIKQNRCALYLEPKTSGKLNSYLADTNQQAETMLDRLVTRIAEQEGVAKARKAENQLLWVQRMNSIRTQTEELVHQQKRPGVEFCVSEFRQSQEWGCKNRAEFG